MFGIFLCFVLTTAVASTTSQSAPQPAQAGDDPSPTTMIEEVLFHPLAFFIPMPGQSEVILIFLEFSFSSYTCLTVSKYIFL